MSQEAPSEPGDWLVEQATKEVGQPHVRPGDLRDGVFDALFASALRAQSCGVQLTPQVWDSMSWESRCIWGYAQEFQDAAKALDEWKKLSDPEAWMMERTRTLECNREMREILEAARLLAEMKSGGFIDGT